MQSKEYTVPGFDLPVIVHHNDDWSGLVVIEWFDSREETYRHTEIPAAVILAISFRETRAMILSELETALEALKGGLR